jgi:hypothetical protein
MNTGAFQTLPARVGKIIIQREETRWNGSGIFLSHRSGGFLPAFKLQYPAAGLVSL